MKQLNEFLKKDNVESIDNKLDNALKAYAKFYDYDANELIASILWHMQDLCKSDSNRPDSFRNGEKALETWKEEFLKAQDIVG